MYQQTLRRPSTQPLGAMYWETWTNVANAQLRESGAPKVKWIFFQARSSQCAGGERLSATQREGVLDTKEILVHRVTVSILYIRVTVASSYFLLVALAVWTLTSAKPGRSSYSRR
jgi:hypothetical protein